MKHRLLIALAFLLAGALMNGPAWLGFAIHTLFYAAILWLLISGSFALRRAIRRKRGQCPVCAYPMGEGLVCSECGRRGQCPVCGYPMGEGLVCSECGTALPGRAEGAT